MKRNQRNVNDLIFFSQKYLCAINVSSILRIASAKCLYRNITIVFNNMSAVRNYTFVYVCLINRLIKRTENRDYYHYYLFFIILSIRISTIIILEYIYNIICYYRRPHIIIWFCGAVNDDIYLSRVLLLT